MLFFVFSIIGVAIVMVAHQVIKAALEPKPLTQDELNEREVEEYVHSSRDYYDEEEEEY